MPGKSKLNESDRQGLWNFVDLSLERELFGVPHLPCYILPEVFTVPSSYFVYFPLIFANDQVLQNAGFVFTTKSCFIGSKRSFAGSLFLLASSL